MDQDVPAASLVKPVAPKPAAGEPRGGDLVRRHAWPVRLWHWVNAAALTVMLMSGLMIFNAHPRLYWGKYGANPDPAWLDLSQVNNGIPFPGWITIPSFYSLSDARLWHFAFAWCLSVAFTGYVAWALIRGHFWRNLVPERAELAPAHVLHDIAEHAKLRFPRGKAALRYNILQKLAYGSVVFLMLPGVILSGMTMSPGLNASLPFLLDLFGGRQSARSVHFLCATGLVMFFLVHLAMVILAGPINGIRSMLTGWYKLPRDRPEVV